MDLRHVAAAPVECERAALLEDLLEHATDEEIARILPPVGHAGLLKDLPRAIAFLILAVAQLSRRVSALETHKK